MQSIQKLKMNLLIVSFIKIFALIISFVIIRVSYDFIDSKELYGIWVTVLSIVSWLNLLNGGLGNGLRNKLSESLALREFQLAKEYVSTTYFVVSVFVLGCIMVFMLFINNLINWASVFNVDKSFSIEIKYALTIIIILFLIQLIFSLIYSIAFAVQDAYVPPTLNLTANILFLAALIFLKNREISPLITISFYYSVIFLFVIVLGSFILFFNRYKDIKPGIKHVRISHAKDLVNKGGKFFLLELFAVFFLTIDIFLVTHFISLKAVSDYQVISKIFSVFTIGVATLMTPFWSMYNTAYTLKKTKWIKNTLFKIRLLFIPLVIFILIFSYFVPQMIYVWMGDEFQIQQDTVYFFAALTIILNWNYIHSPLLNGINELNKQIVVVGLSVMSNIPMSLLFSIKLDMGINGILLGSIIAQVPYALFSIIITSKVFNNKGDTYE